MISDAVTLIMLLALTCLAPANLYAEEVFQEYQGKTLNGVLELAEGKTLADGIILITHSLIQHNGREPLPYVQQLFREKGYSSLAINYSLGIDNRHGPFDCMAPHRYTLDGSLQEIAVWVQWLKEKGAIVSV